MPRLNRQNIDRKTNKPNPIRTEGITPDLLLNRAEQTRRDDDVIRSAKRTIYDIDYAIKWYIDNEIQPQIRADQTIIPVPVIFANGEKKNSDLSRWHRSKVFFLIHLLYLQKSSQSEIRLKNFDLKTNEKKLPALPFNFNYP